MYQSTDIHAGMIVRGRDGKKLGKVFAVGQDRFRIGKGLLFPKAYVARLDDVSDIHGEEIILARDKDSLRRGERGVTARQVVVQEALASVIRFDPPGDLADFKTEQQRQEWSDLIEQFFEAGV